MTGHLSFHIGNLRLGKRMERRRGKKILMEHNNKTMPQCFSVIYSSLLSYPILTGTLACSSYLEIEQPSRPTT